MFSIMYIDKNKEKEKLTSQLWKWLEVKNQ